MVVGKGDITSLARGIRLDFRDTNLGKISTRAYEPHSASFPRARCHYVLIEVVKSSRKQESATSGSRVYPSVTRIYSVTSHRPFYHFLQKQTLTACTHTTPTSLYVHDNPRLRASESSNPIALFMTNEFLTE